MKEIIVEIQRVLGHDVPDVFCKDNIDVKMQNMQIRKKQSKLVQISLLRVDIQMKVIRQICCRETKKPLCI